MIATYIVQEETQPNLVVLKSDDSLILVLDPDDDEIVRSGEVTEIVREP